MLPPTIDLKNDSKEIQLKKIRDACMQHGFFVIVNHTCDFKEIEKTRETMKSFFTSALEEKLKYKMVVDGPHCYGYVPCGGEKSDVANNSLVDGKPVGPRDLMESFNFCDYTKKEQPIEREEKYYSQLKKQYDAFTNQMTELLVLIEEAFDMEKGYLTKKHEFSDVHRSLLRVTHYPPLNHFDLSYDEEKEVENGNVKKDEQNILRIGEHKDLGTLTVLACDDQGGLQVRVDDLETNTHTWEFVPLIENSLIINTGLCMMRLTNDKIQASIHRVVPTKKSNTNSRYSVILFGNGNEEANLKSHEMFGEERKYIEASIGEYLKCKLIQIFEKDARENKGKCRFDD